MEDFSRRGNTGNLGTSRSGRGDPGLIPSWRSWSHSWEKRAKRPLPNPLCDFRWESGAQRGAGGCSESQKGAGAMEETRRPHSLRESPRLAKPKPPVPSQLDVRAQPPPTLSEQGVYKSIPHVVDVKPCLLRVEPQK